ncbi:Two-component response regulator, YesN/AraC family, consists of REC and AraC-type DNA-binding domains [Paenibacillus sp. 1_12]|uniref:response regulator transcription factor n=1 Tax=Paenibacillus sp. 1_12 TaxID=1566278 RepID=UPI0008F17695|nr:helix-turn-helix domain-containing protein [Paenibacillus sp. 1_12]SFL00472.1 Two-component response regulator, YesN/AraC family, consists of REC and AraC-type DNA-binding domains [Paenibacillus sp. 1_12]
MYRVVIVDDEPWALIGIRKLLERSHNRFRIICETTEPAKALEVICKERPDVVFTDIRMPEISGIELMQKTRAKGVEADFIVISGFAEFSYVQHAMQEGAMDYQLKPLDLVKAEEMLEKLYRKLENKRSTADLGFYISLLEESRDHQSLLKTKLHHNPYSRYQVVTVYFKSSEYDDVVLFDLGNKAQFTALKLGPQKCVFIINSDEDKSALIYSSLTAKESLLDRAGISLSSDGADHLAMLLKTSDIASNDCFVNTSMTISQYRKSNKRLVKQFAEQITEALERAQYKNLKGITSGMTAFFIANRLGIEDAVLLWNEMVMQTSGNSEKGSGLMDFELLDYIEIKEKFMNLETLSEYLFELLSFLEPDQPGDANNKFKELLLYTHKHYQEELFLKELSNRFFINISYCCELFRKVTGMTFSQYMTDLRMKKACELLQNSTLSIADVCKSVGYSDYFYFNKVFKRNLGCTPSKYRKTSGDLNALN